jgi:hypothetical protein
MNESLEKANELMREVVNKLSVINETLNKGTADQLKILLRDAEIEKLLNRLENCNRDCTVLLKSINRKIQVH